ncbi:hypothetical protein RN001_013514 [Aquatica leii]|uniref:Uncharacterized protein n=1 Tax=Aquatica leii TaxID=1421715 RepID=A0AAN7SDY4_9COLE|nr:hypothetical protein RN001_013514 [Aquatica leii]
MAVSKEKITNNLDLGDPNFYFGNGRFVMINGDVYEGDYGAHKRGLIWREGYGVYTASDGQIYDGTWLDDEIADDTNVKITFANGDQFLGRTFENKFSGPGVFILDNNLEISCVFFENRPVGQIVLIDLDGRTWTGQAADGNALLSPDNHFYSFISESQGIGELKTKYRETNKPREKKHAEKNAKARKDYFAKSTKTPFDIDFKESKWYQNYLRYDTMFNTIAEKIKDDETLTKEESKWYSKAKKNRQDVKKKRMREKLEKKKSSVDTSLSNSFYSKEFKTRWPAMKVIYPNRDSNTATYVEN